jgi:hypothetical protein
VARGDLRGVRVGAQGRAQVAAAAETATKAAKEPKDKEEGKEKEGKSRPFGEQLDGLCAELDDVAERVDGIRRMRAKDGRRISAKRREQVEAVEETMAAEGEESRV